MVHQAEGRICRQVEGGLISESGRRPPPRWVIHFNGHTIRSEFEWRGRFFGVVPANAVIARLHQSLDARLRPVDPEPTPSAINLSSNCHLNDAG
jgi:hypothetical protein